MQETHLFVDLSRRGNNATLLALYLELLSLKNWQPSLTAHIHNELGEIRNSLGQKHEALLEYRRALEFFRQIGEPEGIIEALNNLGAMHRALTHYQKAQECYQEALRICEEVPHTTMRKGTTLNNLGKLAYDRGKQESQQRSTSKAQAYYREALAWYEQAHSWYQARQLREEEAYSFNNMGDAYRALGEVEKAQKYYWKALLDFQKRGEQRGEGMTLNNLGLFYHELSQRETIHAYRKEAQICWLQALRIFRAIGDRWQEGTTLRNLGRFYALHPEPELEPLEHSRWSLACFVLARNIFEILHNAQSTKIPAWVVENIRLQLANLGSQTYGEFLRETEVHAEDIVEEMLGSEQ